MSILDFSEYEIKTIQAVIAGDFDYDRIPEPLRYKLYDHFADEMPIGTAKARTGDPDNWICDHLHELC